ncbi:MAG TPA: hypothetical protein VLV45_03180 [Gemmatimonadales bacterium]|nr:hypothetical protein [Gemmatimonadales bacterium]
MILGMPYFTFFHVAISLAGIVSGVVVLAGLLSSRPLPGWTATFLVTTALTSITGFGFPFAALLPSHKVGILSLIVLAVASFARYFGHVAGAWRWIYVVGAVAALYFNCFVLVVQLFKHIDSLHALAPTQTERPFQLTQLIVLVLFLAAGIRAVRRFRPAAASSRV